jgi:hypothetical protein
MLSCDTLPVCVQAAASVLYWQLAVHWPRSVPASTVMSTAVRALVKGDVASEEDMRILGYCTRALACAGVCEQLDQKGAIALGASALQFCGALPAPTRTVVPAALASLDVELHAWRLRWRWDCGVSLAAG